MPLLDHFHAPLRDERHWESFHSSWAGSLADALNRQLPERYFAEELTHGGPVEIDVATFEQPGSSANGGGVATLPQTWAPPAAPITLPAVFADDFEVRVFSTRSGPHLVAVLELVSPSNKDRPEARRAFAVKCASYLHQSICVIVIDIVTERQANLHNEILRLLTANPGQLQPDEVLLYAATYRPIKRQAREEIDIWPTRLAIGATLPTLPLALNAELVLPVDLEATYTDARQRRRLG
jgi:hypothetical protein